MRRTTAIMGLVLGVALGTGVSALPAGAKSKPPVKLDGTVNNEGKGKVVDGTVAIEAKDFAFEKTFLKSAPGSVRVELTNEGTVPHTFTIDGQAVDQQVAPGASAMVTVTVDAGKPVTFYCRFHRGSGMRGAFFTAKDKSRSSGSPDSTGSSGGGSDGYGY